MLFVEVVETVADFFAPEIKMCNKIDSLVYQSLIDSKTKEFIDITKHKTLTQNSLNESLVKYTYTWHNHKDNKQLRSVCALSKLNVTEHDDLDLDKVMAVLHIKYDEIVNRFLSDLTVLNYLNPELQPELDDLRNNIATLIAADKEFLITEELPEYKPNQMSTFISTAVGQFEKKLICQFDRTVAVLIAHYS